MGNYLFFSGVKIIGETVSVFYGSCSSASRAAAAAATAAAKSLQSCPTLCDHIDGSPPGSAVPGIL